MLVRVKILEQQHVVFGLLAHIVEPLVRVVLEVHGGAGVMPLDMIGFHEVRCIDGTAVADRQRPVLDAID